MMPLPQLKSLKKMPSGTRSGLLGGGAKSEKDTRNFPIEKKVRFSNRFFQAVTAFASYYFLGSQNNDLMVSHQLWSIVNFNWFLSVAAPCAAGAMVGQYFVPFIVTAWNSRKILTLELLVDTCITILWVACFSGEVYRMAGDCPPGTSHSCDMFNWVLAWNILSAISWFISIGLDIQAFAVGFGFLPQFGERLHDLEMDASIRRMGRH
ncbi:hypothetical protein DFJ73DRAFT_827104 [Zopfochytrium polystomum]|nr:hypothetical protein DFJ73DRAFT_827104 [Zopfochytrium polystomum]